MGQPKNEAIFYLPWHHKFERRKERHRYMIIGATEIISLSQLLSRWTGGDEDTIIDFVNVVHKLTAYIKCNTYINKKDFSYMCDIAAVKEIWVDTYMSGNDVVSIINNNAPEYYFIKKDIAKIEEEYPHLINAVKVFDASDNITFGNLCCLLEKSPQQTCDVLNDDSTFRLVTSVETKVREHIRRAGYAGANDIVFFTVEMCKDGVYDVLTDKYIPVTVHYSDLCEWHKHHPEITNTTKVTDDNDKVMQYREMYNSIHEQNKRLKAKLASAEKTIANLEKAAESIEKQTEIKKLAEWIEERKEYYSGFGRFSETVNMILEGAPISKISKNMQSQKEPIKDGLTRENIARLFNGGLPTKEGKSLNTDAQRLFDGKKDKPML